MDRARGPLRTAPPYARFRCLGCRVFVRGTEAGHCPRCGLVPPTAIALPDDRLAARWPLWIAIAILACAVVYVAAT